MQVERISLRRVHIIGGPGSGKTYLARQLEGCLGIPAHELDKIAFEGPNFVKRSLDERLADVRRIAAQSMWISEGIFLGWTDDLLKAADIIVWLDCVTWRTAMQRIIFRFAHHGINEVKRQPGARKFNRFQDYSRNLRLLWAVFHSSRHYYHARVVGEPAIDPIETRIATAEVLKPYQSKVVRCSTANEIQIFLNSIAAQTSHIQTATAT